MSPAVLALLDQAFTATWHELQARTSSAVSEPNEEATRAAVAQSILDIAATGVRDQGRLKRHGLHAAKLRNRALAR